MLIASPSNKKQRRTRPRMDEDMVMVDPNSLIMIGVNADHNRVEMHVRGPFVTPEYVTQQIASLYELSMQYPAIIIYINSPGGAANTLTELLSAISRFKTVITVAAGQVASAGFFLWCAGDVRVVQRYSTLMAHREGYTYDGKTQQHLEFAQHSERLFGEMVGDLCDDILTETEKHAIRTTEVFLTEHDMLTRKAAISWEQFVARDNIQIDAELSYTIDGVNYTVNGEELISNGADNAGQVYQLHDVIYDMPHKELYHEAVQVLTDE